MLSSIEDLTEQAYNPDDVYDFGWNPDQPRWPGGHRFGGRFRPTGISVSEITPGEKSGGLKRYLELKEGIDSNGLNDWPTPDTGARATLGDKKETRELHGEPTPNGGWEYTPERTALHESIIDKMMRGKDGQPLQPPADGNKQALFMGGGTASGKGSALKLNPQVIPPDAVTIDPDEIKAMLPEYRDIDSS